MIGSARLRLPIALGVVAATVLVPATLFLTLSDYQQARLDNLLSKLIGIHVLSDAES